MVDVHTHSLERSPDVISIVNIFADAPEAWSADGGSSSVGLHPWRVDPGTWPSHIEQVEALSEQPSVTAIGECGLDASARASTEVQVEAFVAQAHIAEKRNLPLIIHCVRRWSELLSLNKALNPSTPWIVHGFRRGAMIAQACIDAGMYLSFGMHALEHDSVAIVARQTPSYRRLYESDAHGEGARIVRSLYERFGESAADIVFPGLADVKSI